MCSRQKTGLGLTLNFKNGVSILSLKRLTLHRYALIEVLVKHIAFRAGGLGSIPGPIKSGTVTPAGCSPRRRLFFESV